MSAIPPVAERLPVCTTRKDEMNADLLAFIKG